MTQMEVRYPRMYKMLLMRARRDLMTSDEATVACAKRRDHLCLLRLMLDQSSVTIIITCLKLLKQK